MSALQAMDIDTPCMFTLLVVERGTPCMSTLLVVERNTPCTSKLLAVEREYTSCTYPHTAGGGNGKTTFIDSCERCYSCYMVLKNIIKCRKKIVWHRHFYRKSIASVRHQHSGIRFSGHEFVRDCPALPAPLILILRKVSILYAGEKHNRRI
jgi:hypothetical protein